MFLFRSNRKHWQLIQLIERNHQITMAAIDDLKTAQAAIAKGVGDVSAYLKTLAGTITGGVSAADAEAIAADLNAQAAALEALVPATPVAGV